MLDLDAANAVLKLASSEAALDVILSFVEAENAKGGLFQVFGHGSIISGLHLKAAYVNTLIAFNDRSNIARRRQMEMLLFAGMTRQIGDAIRRVGVTSAKSFVVFSDNTCAMERFGKISSIKEFSIAGSAALYAAQKLGFGRIPSEGELLTAMARSRLGL